MIKNCIVKFLSFTQNLHGCYTVSLRSNVLVLISFGSKIISWKIIFPNLEYKHLNFLKCHSIISLFMRSIGSVIHSSFEIQWFYNACSLERQHGQDELGQSYQGDRGHWFPSDLVLLSLGLIHTKEKSITEFLKLDQLEIHLVLVAGRLMSNLSLWVLLDLLPTWPVSHSLGLFSGLVSISYRMAGLGLKLGLLYLVRSLYISKCMCRWDLKILHLFIHVHPLNTYLFSDTFVPHTSGGMRFSSKQNKQNLCLDEVHT